MKNRIVLWGVLALTVAACGHKWQETEADG